MSDNSIDSFEGGCLCGRVRWRATGIPQYTYHCHCKMCQRSSGAVFITSVAFTFAEVEWLEGAPQAYQSSEHAYRLFCPNCGSWLAWQWLDQKVSLLAGCFDRPELLQPDAHVFVTNKVSWLGLSDTLPRHDRYPSDLDNQDQGI